MTDVTHEEIVAYVDGEMAPAARAAFETRMAQDPALAREVQHHRKIVAQLRDAFPLAQEKSFDAAELAALGLSDAEVIDLSGAREAGRSRTRVRPIWATALAASMVGGILIGRVTSPAADIRADRQGRLTAAASLEKALDEQADGGAGAVRIGMTFRTASGLCRTFRWRDHAGLGCRDQNGWIIPAVVTSRASESHSTDFRLAGDDFPPSIMAEVDSRIVGAPLDPQQVDAARHRGWR